MGFRILSLDNTINKLIVAVCALFVLVAAMANAVSASEFKRIRDINVACNDALTCDIFITNPSVNLQTVGARRRAGESASVELFLTMREPLASGTNVQLIVDGVVLFEIPVSELSYRAALSEYSYRNSEAALKVLAAARLGENLRVRFSTKAGGSIAQFSLSGITAGMIFADEVQGRIGRDSALMALTAAQRAGSAISAISDATTIYKIWGDVPTTLLSAFGTDDTRCSNDAGTAGDEMSAASETVLNDDTKLISLPCGDPGAYNFPAAFWLQRGDAFHAISLPIIGQEGPTTSDIIWNPVWDASTRTLTSFFKGRGLGDCGEAYQWRLSEVNGAYAFVLDWQRSKDDCDGVYKEDYTDYQQIWPVQ